MNAVKFDELVKARAKQRVNNRVDEFRNTILQAVRVLRPELSHYSIGLGDKEVTDILSCVAKNKDWPRVIWEKEEERVSKELLSVMDEMQKALISIGTIIPNEVFPADKITEPKD